MGSGSVAYEGLWRRREAAQGTMRSEPSSIAARTGSGGDALPEVFPADRGGLLALDSAVPATLPPDGRCRTVAWRHPRDPGAVEVREFLTYLAAGLNVSASTQNQTLNALVFLRPKSTSTFETLSGSHLRV